MGWLLLVWFTDMTQRVRVTEFILRPVISGQPHGSVLGLSLFIMKQNKMRKLPSQTTLGSK